MPKSQSVQVAAAPGARFSPWETAAAAGAILCAGLLAYGNSFAGQFIFDDIIFINDLQTHSPFEYVFCPHSLPRPAVSLTLALNYALGGLAPGGYHVLNLAVHLLAALALLGLVRRTLRLDGLRERFGAVAYPLALAAALLWLVHPLQTESVTYITQRSESLAGLFYLLTLYCVLRGAEIAPSDAGGKNGWRWDVLAVAACALGMACKPTVATAPLAVLAYDRIFLAKDTAGELRKRWKLYAGMAATWLVLAALILVSPPSANAGFGLKVTPLAYAQTQCGVVLHYLCLSFWPFGLCLDYMWPIAHKMEEILPGALVLGMLIAAVLWAWLRRSAWSFPGVWFFIILAPTSSFMPILDPAFEHRMYLPLAALVVLAVVGAYLAGAALLRRLSWPEEQRRVLGKRAGMAAIILAAVLLGYLTFRRNNYYQDPLAMWSDVIEKRPDNWRAYNCRGNAYYANADYDSAIKDFTRASEINPHFAEAHTNLGTARGREGDLEGAAREFDKALNLDRSNWQAWINKGLLFVASGQEAEAQACFAEGLKINPTMGKALEGMAVQVRNQRQVFLERAQKGK